MIRDTRLFVITQATGAVAMLWLMVAWSVWPPSHPLFARWFLLGCGAVALGGFIYNIFMKLSGRPIPRAFWARNLTDKQLWTIKGVLVVGVVVTTFVVIRLAVH